MIITTIKVGELLTNCYLVTSSSMMGSMIIDPGDEPNKIIKAIEQIKIKPAFIVNTHFHPDHLRANIEISKKYNIPCYIGKIESDFIKELDISFSIFSDFDTSKLAFDRLLKEGDSLLVNDLQFMVLETPGHSPGGICLYGQGALFSGDTLFAGDVGRVDIPGGSEKQLIGSFKRLIALPEGTKVYPGHGESTTIKDERNNNVLSMELGPL